MFGIFGFKKKYECSRLQESFERNFAETIRNGACIYAGVETTMVASSEGMIRIHQEQNGRLVNNFISIQIQIVG